MIIISWLSAAVSECQCQTISGCSGSGSDSVLSGNVLVSVSASDCQTPTVGVRIQRVQWQWQWQCLEWKCLGVSVSVWLSDSNCRCQNPALHKVSLHERLSFDCLIAMNKLHKSKNRSDHCFCLEHLSAHASLMPRSSALLLEMKT